MAHATKSASKSHAAMDEPLESAEHHSMQDASPSKIERIRAIQLAEGNFDCYAKADRGECDQVECSWRNDCLLE